MGRSVKTDHEFNHNQVLELLKRAQGKNRSQAAFAKAIGINNNYLCQYMKGNLNRPLTPETLLKIAGAAEDGVTAAELLDASGFDPAKYDSTLSGEWDNEQSYSEDSNLDQFLDYMEQSSPKRFSTSGAKDRFEDYSYDSIRNFKEKAVRAVYKYVNANLSYYNVLIVNRAIPADLRLAPGGSDNKTWGFNYFFYKEGDPFSSTRFRAMHLISRLAMSPADPGGTFFIVTDSETCFQHWSKLAFPLIYQKITILLFDQVDLNIINSKDLKTAML